MRRKSIKKNILLNIIRVGINAIMPMIIFPYVSSVLGPDNMGKISFVSSINSFFCLLAGLGIPSYGVLACSRERDNTERLKRTIAELLYINGILIALSCLIYLLCINFLNVLQPYKHLLYIYFLVIFFYSAGVEWLYIAFEEFSYITIRTFLIRILSIISILLLVKNNNNYIIYAWILVLTQVVNGLVNLLHIRKYFELYNPFQLGYLKHMPSIISFFAATLAGTISANVDTVMLGFWSTDFWVGIYNFSVKIKALFVTIISGIVSAILPRLTHDYNNGKVEEYRDTLRKMYLLLLVTSIGVTCFVCFESLDIIIFLGGIKYLKGRNAMLILSFCVIVMAVTYTFGVGVLQATGNEKQYAKSMYISCTVNVILNAILIPIIGVEGAALSTLLSELVNAVLFIRKSIKIVGNGLEKIGIIKIVCSAIAAAFFVYWLYFSFSGMAVLGRIIVLFLIYVAVYVFMLVLVHKEARTYLTNFYFLLKRKR